MPTLTTMALFLLAALGLLLIPGPSVLYIITRSVAQGRRAGLASVLGVDFPKWSLVSAPGSSILVPLNFSQNSILQCVIK